MEKYSAEEIKEQLRHLRNAHNVSEDERNVVLAMLKEGKRDQGIFAWVKCPVWRMRLYELAKTGVAHEDQLNAICRYMLEGDKRAIANAPIAN